MLRASSWEWSSFCPDTVDYQLAAAYAGNNCSENYLRVQVWRFTSSVCLPICGDLVSRTYGTSLLNMSRKNVKGCLFLAV